MWLSALCCSLAKIYKICFMANIVIFTISIFELLR